MSDICNGIGFKKPSPTCRATCYKPYLQTLKHFLAYIFWLPTLQRGLILPNLQRLLWLRRDRKLIIKSVSNFLINRLPKMWTES